MNPQTPTSFDRVLAEICLNCMVCRHARKKQNGAAYWLVRKMESNVCPFCRAYERVYGRKPHDPLIKTTTASSRADQ
jgi:hypothetical protein